jgi:peptidoglycan/LPS O-acetylase OafA/YrhL
MSLGSVGTSGAAGEVLATPRTRTAHPLEQLGEGSGHLAQLDALRAFAIIAVMVRHFWPEIQPDIDLGSRGVRLFFVLSGFLITGILLRSRMAADIIPGSRGYAIRHFYIRRALRIMPVYYLTLAVTGLVGVGAIRQFLDWHLLFGTNIHFALQGDYGGPASHLWSISVEEQFYLLWPWIVFFVPLARLPIVLGGTVLVGPVFRLAGYLAGVNWVALNVLPMSSLDSLGLGALLAWFYAARAERLPALRRTLRRLALVAIPIILIAWTHRSVNVPAWGGWVRLVPDDTAWAVLSLWLIDRAAQGFTGTVGRLLEWRPLVYLGTISYGVYLFHLFVPDAWYLFSTAVGLPLLRAKPLQFLAWSIVSVALAAVSWHLVERPINSLKTLFPYSPPAGRSQSPSGRPIPVPSRRRDDHTLPGGVGSPAMARRRRPPSLAQVLAERDRYRFRQRRAVDLTP